MRNTNHLYSPAGGTALKRGGTGAVFCLLLALCLLLPQFSACSSEKAPPAQTGETEKVPETEETEKMPEPAPAKVPEPEPETEKQPEPAPAKEPAPAPKRSRTVAVYDFDEAAKSAHQVAEGEIYGVRCKVTAPFDRFSYCIPTWTQKNSAATLALYVWNDDTDAMIEAG
ncbi:MAG: hypothetical protein II779_03950, partial [Clostridia bacterium]|nr:hypothetical protein [Clostridia bacterium]